MTTIDVLMRASGLVKALISSYEEINAEDHTDVFKNHLEEMGWTTKELKSLYSQVLKAVYDEEENGRG